MAGLYRAYGQIRRASGVWRTPFLIPIGDLVPPLIQGSSNVSVDTNGSAPDLRFALVLQSIDHYPTIGVQFRIQPLPGRTLKDITLRMVLLQSGDSPFLDSGPLETAVSFVVLQYRVGPNGTFPTEVKIDLTSGVASDDFDSTVVTPPGSPEPIPAGHRKLTVDKVGLTVVDAPTGESLDVAGGLVSGDMVRLNGVETNFNSLLNTGYVENAHQIRGIALDRLELGAPASATLPNEATWFEVRASTASTTSHLKSRRVSVDLRTPTRGSAPEEAPTLAEGSGGTLRFGTYRYSTTFLHKNGNESGSSPQSEPVSIADPAKRSVIVENLPATPPKPVPDNTALEVTKIRVYRTDCDVSGDPSDPDRGSRGEEVLVAEVAPSTTSVTDTGPADPGSAPVLHDDFIAVRYAASEEFNLSGSLRMIDGAEDTRYSGTVDGAPTYLKVIYRPGKVPKLRWLAPTVTPLLGIAIPSMELPYGTGLAATLEELPPTFCLDWRILGSEFVGLGLAGDVSPVLSASPDPAIAPGRVSVKMGGVSVPSMWPQGEPEVAVELVDASTGTPGGAVSLSAVRRASLSLGAVPWAQRDVESGRIVVESVFAEMPPFSDRRMRLRYRSGISQDQIDLNGTAHFVPDRFELDARLREGEDKVVSLASRVRLLRADLDLRMTGEESGSGTRVSGHAFVDDTTDALSLILGGSGASLHTEWPIRAGAVLAVESDPPIPDNGPLCVWADVVAPSSIRTTIGLPLEVNADESGLSGRFAAAWSAHDPLAVRATPQVKALTDDSAGIRPGIRAVTARILGVTRVVVPKEITSPFGLNPPSSTEASPVIQMSSGRPNSSFRFELHQVDDRVPTDPDMWSVDPARSWLRARTSHLPERIEPLIVWAGNDLAGAAVRSSMRWGDGVLWAEPRFAWTEHTDQLGTDRGVGILTAGFDGVAATIEFWRLDHAGVLGANVQKSDQLPSVGPVGVDWPPGGVVLRMDSAVRLSHLLVAMPEGAGWVCRTDDGPHHSVRNGNWFSAISPFIHIEPMGTGLKQVVLWATRQPSAPSSNGGDPCGSSGGADKVESALGWSIEQGTALSLAVRLYELVTPSGAVTARWWLMPTRDEEWNGEDVHAGRWELQQELQMKDYRGTVVLYPEESTDNPFGDWKGGDGHWWLRQRDGLDVPIFLLFGPTIASGDVYMGNVGGGYHMPGTNGIFSTLPKIWTWSYP